MPLQVGTRFGPYEIVSPIGAGGMGEVYRAHDSRLGRDVAIKVLPAEFANDTARQQRFEREARAISALNHPNICVLHDVGHQDGVPYLVMECVDGETLAARLEKGPLPVEQALRIGWEMAEALDRAHRHGVVHRDLKPGNIMLTKSGAKLLDFGLARPVSSLAPMATVTVAHETTGPVTQEGTIVGTFQYMSPEQLSGKDVDGRSDLFALGAVLYETMAGRPAFEGASVLSVAGAVLEKDPPPMTASNPRVPANVERVVRRCLAKDPDERWQTARDLAEELKWLASGPSASSSAASVPQVAAPAPHRQMPGWLPWAGLALVATSWLASASWHSKPVDVPAYFGVPTSRAVRSAAVAPNGHTVVLAAYDDVERRTALWLYEVGEHDMKRVPDTDDGAFPFWSPDGKSIGFFAFGKLKRVEIAGGTAQVLCDAPSGRGGTWNLDGVIVYSPSGQLTAHGLYRVSARGGEPVRLTTPDAAAGEESHRWPVFLPDGKHFIYFAVSNLGDPTSDTRSIYLTSLDAGERTLVLKAASNALYVEPGYLLFARDKTLLAQRFDASRGVVSGEPVPLMTNLQSLPRVAYSVFAAGTGALLAQSGGLTNENRMVWYDRHGVERGTAGGLGVYANPVLDPSGRLLAFDQSGEDGNVDVWLSELDGGNRRRLTFERGIDALPIWSPDGQRVLFASDRRHAFGVYAKNVDGGQAERLVIADDSHKVDFYPSDWSHDGRAMLFERDNQVWVGDGAGQSPRAFLASKGEVASARVSPDGKWVAYASNETGQREVFVTSFPEATGKWQVSTGGGTQPHWRGDGRELFFLAPDGSVMAANVSSGTPFTAQTPTPLFRATPRELLATSEQGSFDVTKDGQRFLIVTPSKANTQPMSIVLHWMAQVAGK